MQKKHKQETTALNVFLGDFSSVLTATGVFGAVALAAQSFIPGWIGLAISLLLEVSSVLLLTYFIFRLLASQVSKHVKFWVTILSTLTSALFAFHLIFLVSYKPLDGQSFYLYLFILMTIVTVLVFGLLGMAERIASLKHLRSRLLAVSLSFFLMLVLPGLIVNGVKNRYGESLDDYANIYYPNRAVRTPSNLMDSKLFMDSLIQGKFPR